MSVGTASTSCDYFLENIRGLYNYVHVCTIMYMNDKTVEMTVAEFRKNVKAALDYAVQGGVVIIDRMGQKFMLTNIPRDVSIEFASTPKGTNPFFETGKDPSKTNTLTPPTAEVFITNDLPSLLENADFIAEKNNSEAKASNSTDGFVEAGVDPSGELVCCKKAVPCKHWQWDGVEQAYVNTISGRKKEA